MTDKIANPATLCKVYNRGVLCICSLWEDARLIAGLLTAYSLEKEVKK